MHQDVLHRSTEKYVRKKHPDVKKIKLLKNNYEYIPSQSDVNHLVVATGAVTIS